MDRTTVALGAVKEASAFLKKQFHSVQKATEKKDGTLVSAADHGSDQLIIAALQKAFPDDGILSEERDEVGGSSGYRWILDPLDGTHNFLAGIPLFGILLALEKEGDIILSICSFPVIDEVFVAERGKGATLNGKKISVSSAKTVEGSVFLADGNIQFEFDSIIENIRPFFEQGCRFRFLGEGPFGLTRVAMGMVVAATMRQGKAWDIAAPSFLVQEAGGTVTDFSGKPWDLQMQGLVATNGAAHQSVLQLLPAAL